MIGWPDFADEEVANIIYYIKTFSENFEDSYFYDAPITIPEPPPYSAQSAQLGREVYERMECFLCHGDQGRGDGPSAPTLEDDAGRHIRPADMTKRWTFRGGPSRKEIYRTFSTGMNGTPMPSYADLLKDEERWRLVDYIYSLGESDEPNYSDRLFAKSIEEEIDISEGEALFADCQAAYFPMVGQIMEPEREFHPPANAIEVKAVHNEREIAFLLKWHDMGADISGANSPASETLPLEPPSQDKAEGTTAGETGDAETRTEEESDRFLEEEYESEDEQAEGSDFSDAVAIQFPSRIPEGIRLPYFVFGDLENSVDLWFADLAQDKAQRFLGRGSRSIVEDDAGDLAMIAQYQDGEWSVIFKQKRRSENGISFREGEWVPVAFSIWDGFSEERANKRALTSWYAVYIEPAKIESPVAPMSKAALATLGVEILVIAWVRRKHRKRASGEKDA